MKLRLALAKPRRIRLIRCPPQPDPAVGPLAWGATSAVGPDRDVIADLAASPDDDAVSGLQALPDRRAVVEDGPRAQRRSVNGTVVSSRVTALSTFIDVNPRNHPELPSTRSHIAPQAAVIPRPRSPCNSRYSWQTHPSPARTAPPQERPRLRQIGMIGTHRQLRDLAGHGAASLQVRGLVRSADRAAVRAPASNRGMSPMA